MALMGSKVLYQQNAQRPEVRLVYRPPAALTTAKGERRGVRILPYSNRSFV